MNKLTLPNGLLVLIVLVLAGSGCWNREADAAVPGGIAGIYSGAITYYRFPGPVASAPRRLFGAIGKDGNGYFISTSPGSGEIQVFRHLAGAGAIVSPEYAVPTEGQAVGRGVQKWKIEIRPRSGGGSSYQLVGKFRRVDGYAALALRRSQPADRHASLADRSGAYGGFNINSHTSVELALFSDGRLSGTNAAGCRIAGRLVPLGNLGVFDARMRFAGPAKCRTAMTGVAFFDARDRSGGLAGAGPYLYVIGANGDFSRGFAVVLVRRHP